jgi:hypothetical protein
MEKEKYRLICLLPFLLILCSCTYFNSNDDERTTICKELNQKLIFSGNTSNTRRAEIQNSEDPLLQRQYEKYHCDQS